MPEKELRPKVWVSDVGATRDALYTGSAPISTLYTTMPGGTAFLVAWDYDQISHVVVDMCDLVLQPNGDVTLGQWWPYQTKTAAITAAQIRAQAR